MKGLLIKDLQLIKNQKQFLGLTAVISIIFTLYYDNMLFTITYMTAMLSLASISTISYDQHANGMSFLMTLPASRSDYAKEKYLLMLLVMGVSLVISLLLVSVKFFLHDLPLEEDQLSGALLGSILCTILIHSIMIPLNLKFEAEKSRLAMFVVMGVVYAIAFASLSLLRYFHIDVDALLQKAAPVSAGIILFVILAGLLVISFLLSLRIMKRKDF